MKAKTMIQLSLLSMIIFLSTGCMSKKKIQLKSLSLVTLEDIENGYLTKNNFQYQYRGACFLKFRDRREQLLQNPNKFLKINFTSKEDINIFEDRRAGLYVFFRADGKHLESLDFCPLAEKNVDGYSYSLFYPTSYKIKKEYFRPKEYDEYNIFNLKKTKEFRLKIETVGYTRWKANEIVITKDMIDRLEL